MKVYIAAPWDEREDARAVASRLTSLGHEITHNWWDYDGEAGSRAYLASCAAADMDAVLDSEVLLLLNTQPRGAETSGKAVETGLALSMWESIRILAVGEPSNVFHYLPAFKWFATVEDAIGALDEGSL